MRYGTVLFDVGETLIGPRLSFGATYAAALAEHGLELPAERLDEAIRHVAAAIEAEHPAGEDRYRREPGGDAAYWRRFSERVVRRALEGEGAEPARVERLAGAALTSVREAFRSPTAWRVYEDSVPTLEALGAAGVRLGVVSNWDSRLAEVLRLLGLDGYFEVLGVSHLEGVEKPSPLLFERVLERMGSRAAETLHVGDRPDMDLEGARRAGIDAVLIDRRGAYEGLWPRTERLEPLVAWAREGLPAR